MTKLFFIVLLLSLALLIFKVQEVPPGIETDEGSIGYNAALISNTLRDRTGRFLPVFVLSSNNDWKQPVLIYTSALAFKFFGPSPLVLKLVNIVFCLLGLTAVWFLLRLLLGDPEALVGTVVFITTPIVIITSRIGNESIIPVFFSALWLLGLALFRRNGKPLYLILTALALGFGFYSFKGMRLVIPIWSLLSLLYIYWRSLKKDEVFQVRTLRGLFVIFRKSIFNRAFLINAAVFVLFLLPFFLIIPTLEHKYPGAIFDHRDIPPQSYQENIYYWLSNLSLPFLFLKGDVGKIYSIQLYGAFLLGALPLFLIGVKKALTQLSFFSFILASYLLTPLLFGLAGSIDYGHRLVASVPLYICLVVLGYKTFVVFLKNSHNNLGLTNLLVKILASVTLIFFVFSALSFIVFYYFHYGTLNDTKSAFPNNLNSAFYSLSQESKKSNLTPYIQEEIYNLHGEGNKFFEISYFDKPINIWKLGHPLPPRSIVLTQIESFPGTENIHEANIAGLNLLETN